jgi:Ca-activated chloride channel family protein
MLLRHLPALLRGLALGALAIALARPQTVGGVIRIAAQGVAIVVALDQSSSMNAVDFPTDRDTRRISRLKAAKDTFIRFVAGRPDDLIGLCVFANYPDLACPPTLDHRFLAETADAIGPARPGDDGTNIGAAIAW